MRHLLFILMFWKGIYFLSLLFYNFIKYIHEFFQFRWSKGTLFSSRSRSILSKGPPVLQGLNEGSE